MKRPVTIFTGQWADLGMEEMCETAEKMGYEGEDLEEYYTNLLSEVKSNETA